VIFRGRNRSDEPDEAAGPDGGADSPEAALPSDAIDDAFAADDALPDTGMPHDGYCIDCQYSLRGLTSNACPECGRPFNPDNPTSYLRTAEEPERRRIRRILAYAGRIALIVVFAIVARAAAFGLGVFAEEILATCCLGLVLYLVMFYSVIYAATRLLGAYHLFEILTASMTVSGSGSFAPPERTSTIPAASGNRRRNVRSSNSRTSASTSASGRLPHP